MKLKTTAAIIVAAGALLAPTAASAFDQPYFPYQPGNPQLNGCPSGWEALQVSVLTAAGYGLPAKLDSGQVGKGGNNDGIVCGKPVSTAEEQARFSGETVPVIFQFTDNTLQPYNA
jgi:hypothetical protein